MKKIFLISFAFITSFFTQVVMADAAMRINKDAEDQHESIGVAISLSEKPKNSPLQLTYGVSFNTIKSNLALEKAGRNQIYPVYGFANLSFKYAVSPYIELGIDIGDALTDKAFEGDGSDVDVYYSFGIEVRVQKTIGVAFYHKTYDLNFNEINDPTLQNVIIDMTGVSLSYYIN